MNLTRFNNLVNLILGVSIIGLALVGLISTFTVNFNGLIMTFFIFLKIDFIRRNLKFRYLKQVLINDPVQLVIFIPIVGLILFPESFQALLHASFIVFTINNLKDLYKLIKSYKITMPQLIMLGFIGLIFLGSILLSLPISNNSGQKIQFIDSFFISTSAVCVTGLTTTNIMQQFSIFGHVIILILTQIGGLGIMFFSALLGVMINKKISLKQTESLQSSYNTNSFKDSFRLIVLIIKFTLGVEMIGSVIFFIHFLGQNYSIGNALFYSVFHSVSAFCNAGFTLFSNSLETFNQYPLILFCFSILIILGGIGFPVIHNLLGVYKSKHNRFSRLNLNTKLTITISLGLLLFGFLIILISQWELSLQNMTLSEKLSAAFFQSATIRTAGFNSIDFASMSYPVLVIVVVLMVIGAAPGSTGGGIKVTTFGIISITFWKTLTSEDTILIFKRKVTNANILKAFSLILLSGLILLGSFLWLLSTDNHTIFNSFFEVCSAFGTVGLSLGITDSLSFFGKLNIIIVMFIGRIGPATVAYAFSRPKQKVYYSYPEEGVIIS